MRPVEARGGQAEAVQGRGTPVQRPDEEEEEGAAARADEHAWLKAAGGAGVTGAGDPGQPGLTPAVLRALQRSAGNAAVQAYLEDRFPTTPVQRAPADGPPIEERDVLPPVPPAPPAIAAGKAPPPVAPAMSAVAAPAPRVPDPGPAGVLGASAPAGPAGPAPAGPSPRPQASLPTTTDTAETEPGTAPPVQSPSPEFGGPVTATTGAGEADAIAAELAALEDQANAATRHAAAALQGDVDRIRQSVIAAADGARNRLGAAYDQQQTGLRSATDGALAEIAGARAAQHQAITAEAATQHERLTNAHRTERDGGPATIAAAKERVRSAGESEAQRATVESGQRAEAIQAEAAAVQATGESASVDAQRTAATRIATRAAEQCRQTGAQVASSVRQEATQFAGRSFDSMLRDFTAGLDRTSSEAGSQVDGFTRQAHARIDELATGATETVRELGRQGAASLDAARSAALNESAQWSTATLSALDKAAEGVQPPDDAAGAAAEFRQQMAAPVDQLRGMTDPAGIARRAGELSQTVAAGREKVLGALDEWAGGARTRLTEPLDQELAAFESTTAAREGEAVSAGQQLAGKVQAAAQDATAGMQSATAGFRDRLGPAIDGAVADFARAGAEFRSRVQQPADECVRGLARMVDDALASEDRLLSDARSQMRSSTTQIAGRYEELKTEADRRSASEGTASRMVQRSWLGSLWNSAVKWVGSVKQWFANTFGEFWGGLLFGILEALVIVVIGILAAYVVGWLVGLVIASAEVVAIVTAVILIVAAIGMGIYARFQEFEADNPGKKPSFWQSVGLVALGIADLTGIPYLVEGIVGQRAFGKELHGFERGERIGMGIVFLVAFAVTVFRGVKAFLRSKAVDIDPGKGGPGPEPGKGGYEAIDSARPPAGLTITDLPIDTGPDGVKRITTVVQSGTNQGHVTRAYDPATRKLIMEEAFLDKIPADQQWVDVDGQRMRLQTYVTLRQMRALGVGFGSLETVKMSTIQNALAVMQLDQALKRGVPLDQAVLQTHSVQYAQRTLVPAGEKVVGARVEGSTRTPIDVMLSHYEARDPSLIPKNDKLLSDHGLTRSDVVLWNYDIYLDVQSVAMPAPTVGAPVPAGSETDDQQQ
jgi:hypothetical protein